jgi:hypothetical protein
MAYICPHYILQFFHRLTKEDNLSSSVMKACSSVITDKRLDVSYSVLICLVQHAIFVVLTLLSASRSFVSLFSLVKLIL